MTRREALAQRLIETCERERRRADREKARRELVAKEVAAAPLEERGPLLAREVVRLAEGILRRRQAEVDEDDNEDGED